MINRLTQSDPNHNYHTLHYGKPPKMENVQQYQEKTYKQMFELLSVDKDFILDRSHIGEMIWSPIYRSYDAKPYIQRIENTWDQSVKTDKNIFLFVLVDSVYDKWVKRDDRQGLNNTGSESKHMTEISYFQDCLNMTCIERKFIYDLKYWYNETGDTDRIDDRGLYDHIFQIVSTAD